MRRLCFTGGFLLLGCGAAGASHADDIAPASTASDTAADDTAADGNAADDNAADDNAADDMPSTSLPMDEAAPDAEDDLLGEDDASSADEPDGSGSDTDAVDDGVADDGIADNSAVDTAESDGALTHSESDAGVNQASSDSAATGEQSLDAGSDGTEPVALDAGLMQPIAVVPSPGCALQQASPVLTLDHFEGTQVRLPSSYDGSTPQPLLMGLHETGNVSEILFRIPADHGLSAQYVIVAPRNPSVASGFETATVADYDALLSEVLATYCVDESRVFLVGHGSGARFGRRLTTDAAHGYRAVAFIGTMFNTRAHAVPLLFIHGLDNKEAVALGQDAAGEKALQSLLISNNCSADTLPVDTATCTSENETVTPGCLDYSDCSAPVRFCHHDDPARSGRNDDWPCFATDQLQAFFAAYL